MTLPLVVLNGPTASGKSSLAIQVAQELGRRGVPSEIVNSDSMLVYRGMDIGTAKPTPEELALVPHHLVDVAEVTWTASVADFQTRAREVIAELRDRGVVPVLVGGSALYVHAILDEFSFPGTDPEVRAHYEAELAQKGSYALHAELASRDASVAAGILPGNGRRIVRALEVLDLQGGFTPQLPQWTYALDDVLQFGLQLDRERMDARIDDRVDQMWQAGLVDEVRQLEGHGLRDGLTASRALGYRQVLMFLDGELTEAEARERTKSGTRRFARKQLAWFRRDPRITWLDAEDPGNATVVVERVLRAGSSTRERLNDGRVGVHSPKPTSVGSMRTWTFAKGHGTKNDFVIVRDRHGMVRISDADVRYLCDRRAGIGGDGFLRVTKASSIPEWQGDPDLWFMDYRNADGSVAEMCGNGLRVFARYLLEEDLDSGESLTIATRAGVRQVWPLMDGRLRTTMGTVVVADEPVAITTGDGAWQATEVSVGNPHAVCFLEPGEQLESLDLGREPVWEPASRFPNGTNVEFVEVHSPRHIAMRVHERGAGETMSCGTGTVAAAAAHARRAGLGDGEVRVDVPGGWLTVELTGGEAFLTGPATIVARGQATLPDSL